MKTITSSAQAAPVSAPARRTRCLEHGHYFMMPAPPAHHYEETR